jgi:hypothetical protein
MKALHARLIADYCKRPELEAMLLDDRLAYFAIHEAEKVLDTETNLLDDADGFESARDRYMNKLQSITDQRPTHQDDCEWQFLTATAAQRADAFLKTLNLWKE